MAVKVCPECRHEIAGRGRYCMFCGCDLRKTPRTAAPVQQGKDRHEENREPDERFREKPGTIRKAALVIVLALLVMAGPGLRMTRAKSLASSGQAEAATKLLDALAEDGYSPQKIASAPAAMAALSCSGPPAGANSSFSFSSIWK